MLSDVLIQCVNDDNVIIGGDWNCTEDFILDCNSEEPHIQTSTHVSKLVREADLLDIWRIKYPNVRQDNWVKVTDNRISAGR